MGVGVQVPPRAREEGPGRETGAFTLAFRLYELCFLGQAGLPGHELAHLGT